VTVKWSTLLWQQRTRLSGLAKGKYNYFNAINVHKAMKSILRNIKLHAQSRPIEFVCCVLLEKGV